MFPPSMQDDSTSGNPTSGKHDPKAAQTSESRDLMMGLPNEANSQRQSNNRIKRFAGESLVIAILRYLLWRQLQSV
jgi:hypothetical protein